MSRRKEPDRSGVLTWRRAPNAKKEKCSEMPLFEENMYVCQVSITPTDY